MKQKQWIIGTFALVSLTACTHDKWGNLPEGDVELDFTASAETPVTRTVDGTTALTNGAYVAVYVGKGGNKPSSETAPDYTNAYTVQVNVSGKADELVPTGGVMKVESANGYSFYALSTNSASRVVPGLANGCHAVDLHNGVDYLMAVNDNSGKGFNITTGLSPIPLAFRHLATQVILTVKPASKNGYTAASGLTVGIADIDNTGCYIDLSAAWAASAATPSPMIYWPAQSTTDGSTPTPVTGGVPLEQPDGQQKVATQSGTTFTVSFILLPVSTSARGIPLQLDFSGLSFENGGTNAFPSKSYTARMMATGEATELELKGGYTYSFEATITRNSASFSIPKVEPWVIDGVNLDEVVEVDPK